MKRNRSTMTHAVLSPLRSAWEDTVAAGLRQATDVELLWMLDEIEAQLGERTTAWKSRPASDELAEGPDDIPDWDDKTPEELEALLRELEADTADEEEEVGFPEFNGARTIHKAEQPHALRRTRSLTNTDKLIARLRCEELEPRYPPTTLVVVFLQPTPAVALISTWTASDTGSSLRHEAQGSAPAMSTSSAAWNDDAADHLAHALVA